MKVRGQTHPGILEEGEEKNENSHLALAQKI
jgi:hypothetical protein